MIDRRGTKKGINKNEFRPNILEMNFLRFKVHVKFIIADYYFHQYISNKTISGLPENAVIITWKVLM